MGYPTRVQLIKRKASEQWYINFPAALAQACDFSKGETVEWVVRDKYYPLSSNGPRLAAALRMRG